ncbi:hypothetical protein DEO72_LG8g2289 [Vigna unguiculata]|uniref:Uncharacterized protein n=1 Tax=Vigna unguiculata TaxID=3917 RepID=A0A4D6MWJ8_VIGUN|nr:hypothetical protein DEO72_LG8g2289 [Vigna unguiculata]
MAATVVWRRAGAGDGRGGRKMQGYGGAGSVNCREWWPTTTMVMVGEEEN